MAEAKRPPPDRDPEYDPAPKAERHDAHVEERSNVKAYDAPDKTNVMSWGLIATVAVFVILAIIFVIYAF